MRLPTGERTCLLSIALENVPRKKRNTCNAQTKVRKGGIPPGSRLEGVLSGLVSRSPLARNLKAAHKDKRGGRSRREMVLSSSEGSNRRREGTDTSEHFELPTTPASCIYTNNLLLENRSRLCIPGWRDRYFPLVLPTGRFNRGMGRLTNTTFFFTTAEICHSTPAPPSFSSSSASISDTRPSEPVFFSITASGVGNETIFPSRRCGPITSEGLF